MSRMNVASRPASQRSAMTALGFAALACWLWLAPPAVGQAEAGLGSVELIPVSPEAVPPLPDPAVFPVQLVLDDDMAEGAFGFLGGAARQFLWLNRFVDPGLFALEEIWVLFPSGTDVVAGDAVQLAVFVDPDGDPTNGAQLLATFDEVVQAADGNTFSVYTLSPRVQKSTVGDVLIGVVNRYHQTGVDPPPTLPAAFDSTATLNQSYFALWPGDPPDPPNLATASSIDLLAGASEGNFMIRGFGVTQAPSVSIPALDGTGLALLALLMALAGVALTISRR